MTKPVTMESVLEFVRSYVTATYETEVASYTEHDQDAFLRRFRRLEQYFAKGVQTGIPASLPKYADEEDRAAFTAKAGRLVTPLIFKIKQWRHPEHGVLYQVYIGATTPAKHTGYGKSLLIAPRDGELKIVARYTPDLACFATGQHAGAPCPDCRGLGWEYLDGLKLPSFGTPEQTLRIEAPSWPKFAAEYERD
jgi:hypothetical protein